VIRRPASQLWSKALGAVRVATALGSPWGEAHHKMQSSVEADLASEVDDIIRRFQDADRQLSLEHGQQRDVFMQTLDRRVLAKRARRRQQQQQQQQKRATHQAARASASSTIGNSSSSAAAPATYAQQKIQQYHVHLASLDAERELDRAAHKRQAESRAETRRRSRLHDVHAAAQKTAAKKGGASSARPPL
jgi:hypothetical protein